MPRTRSGKEHDPVKREEERKHEEQIRQLAREARLRRIAQETEKEGVVSSEVGSDQEAKGWEH
jgi:hypothetical protein